MAAVDEHRHQQRVVGGVRVAAQRIVVQERVARREVGVQLAHRARLQSGAEHVRLQPLGRGQQLVVGGHDAAREVARHVEHRAATGAEQRVRHLADDHVEAVGEHRGEDGAELACARRWALIAAPGRSCRARSCAASRRAARRPSSRLGDEQRSVDLGAGSERPAVEHRHVDLAGVGEVRAPRARRGGARRRPRSAPRTGVNGRATSRPRHWRISTRWPGSRSREDPLVQVVEGVDDALDGSPAPRASRSPSGSSSVHTWWA